MEQCLNAHILAVKQYENVRIRLSVLSTLDDFGRFKARFSEFRFSLIFFFYL